MDIHPLGEGPCPRRRMCCALLGSSFYIFGGTRFGIISLHLQNYYCVASCLLRTTMIWGAVCVKSEGMLIPSFLRYKYPQIYIYIYIYIYLYPSIFNIYQVIFIIYQLIIINIS